MCVASLQHHRELVIQRNRIVLVVGWAAFWLYWLAAAFSMKRGRVPWSRELAVRAVIVVLVIVRPF